MPCFYLQVRCRSQPVGHAGGGVHAGALSGLRATLGGVGRAWGAPHHGVGVARADALDHAEGVAIVDARAPDHPAISHQSDTDESLSAEPA